ncbi:MAG: hypothetical protein M3010_03525, partial [Candidatus Dormibacteraeota bacterium]|nr:hypothetical protein [Candidatus Dormibacteraeota bacterium]
MTDPTIYIAAKPPLAGVVKTRLAGSIGDGPAVALYIAFLQDLAAEVGGVGTAVGWFIPAQPPWRPPSLGPRQVATRWQRGPTWSARQAGLFADCHRAGYPATVLIASD